MIAAKRITRASVREGDPQTLAAICERPAVAVFAYCEQVARPGYASVAAARALAHFRATVARSGEMTADQAQVFLRRTARQSAAWHGSNEMRAREGTTAPDNCAGRETELLRYVEGALSADPALGFEKHLLGCNLCAAALRRLEAGERAYDRPPAVSLPPRVAAEILGAMTLAAPVTACGGDATAIRDAALRLLGDADAPRVVTEFLALESGARPEGALPPAPVAQSPGAAADPAPSARSMRAATETPIIGASPSGDRRARAQAREQAARGPSPRRSPLRMPSLHLPAMRLPRHVRRGPPQRSPVLALFLTVLALAIGGGAWALQASMATTPPRPSLITSPPGEDATSDAAVGEAKKTTGEAGEADTSQASKPKASKPKRAAPKRRSRSEARAPARRAAPSASEREAQPSTPAAPTNTGGAAPPPPPRLPPPPPPAAPSGAQTPPSANGPSAVPGGEFSDARET